MLMLAIVLAAAAPGQAKIQQFEAALFESVEMANECAAARAVEAEYQQKLIEREVELKRLEDQQIPPKPVEQMRVSEMGRWTQQKRIKAQKLLDAQGPDPEPPELDTRLICTRATTAVLSKGVEVAVIERGKGWAKVRVDTGRATGKTGWVRDADIAEPKKP